MFYNSPHQSSFLNLLHSPKPYRELSSFRRSARGPPRKPTSFTYRVSTQDHTPLGRFSKRIFIDNSDSANTEQRDNGKALDKVFPRPLFFSLGVSPLLWRKPFQKKCPRWCVISHVILVPTVYTRCQVVHEGHAIHSCAINTSAPYRHFHFFIYHTTNYCTLAIYHRIQTAREYIDRSTSSNQIYKKCKGALSRVQYTLEVPGYTLEVQEYTTVAMYPGIHVCLPEHDHINQVRYPDTYRVYEGTRVFTRV